jgi:hypothetical protein
VEHHGQGGIKIMFSFSSLPESFSLSVLYGFDEKRYFPNISNSQNNWRIRKRYISGSEEREREEREK